jgi:hypothetical protein
VLLEGHDAFRMYATEQDGAPGREDGASGPISISRRSSGTISWSSASTFSATSIPTFHGIARTIESGHRSIVRAMLRSRGPQARRVWPLPRASRTHSPSEHEAIVLALADMVAAALEHERLWNEEHRPRRRVRRAWSPVADAREDRWIIPARSFMQTLGRSPRRPSPTTSSFN